MAARPSSLGHQIDRARRSLRLFGAVETALAGLLAGAFFLVIALVLVDVLPFSYGTRAVLWALGPVAFVLTGAGLFVRRLLPLRDDEAVAGALERGAARRGTTLWGEAVSAAELLRGQGTGSPTMKNAFIADVAARLSRAGAHRGLVELSWRSARVVVAIAVLAAGAFYAASTTAVFQDRWAQLFDDEVAEKRIAERALLRVPLVTNLTVTLSFPAYMERGPETVEGSSGDVAAPRGTFVDLSGLSDRPIGRAALLYGDAEIALTVEDQRRVSGRFVLEEAGTYRFVVHELDGDKVLDPVAHKVTLVADRVPEVVLAAPPEDRVVQLDEDIEVLFSGTDDFGLTGFRLVVRRQQSGGQGFEKSLMELSPALAKAGGRGTFTPAEAGAKAGDKLSVYVEALDNDTIAGPKVGRSETRVLTVFSAALHHRELIDLQQALLDAMLESLADELEHPVDAAAAERADPAQGQALDEHERIGNRHAAMLEAFGRVLTHLRTDELAPDDIKAALTKMSRELSGVVDKSRELVSAAKKTLQSGRALPAYFWRDLGKANKKLVAALEKDVLYLDDLLTRQRLEEVETLTAEMRDAQKNLKELIEQYKKSPDDQTREAILEEIRALREQMQKIAERLAELRRDIPDEHINKEAMHQAEQMQDAQSIDELIEQGKVDEALQQLEQMMQQTEQLLDGLSESRQEFGDESYRELAEKMEKFGAELQAVQAEQEQLLDQSQRMLDAAQKRALEKTMKQMQEVWPDLLEKAKQAQKDLQGIDDSRLFPHEREDLAGAQSRVDDLVRALEAEDVADAQQSAEDAERMVRTSEQDVADRVRGRFGSRDPSMKDAAARLKKARPRVEDVRDELDKLLPDPRKFLDEGQRQLMKKNAERQQQLKKRTQQLQKQMRDIDKEAPIFGEEPQQMLQRAGEQMGMAQNRLRSQRLREGKSSQGRASQELKALGERMQQMAQQQGQSGGVPIPLPGGGSDGGGDQEGNGRHTGKEDVKIPGAEQYRVPDAFRKDILDAMREDAPENYQREVKKYYEELVK